MVKQRFVRDGDVLEDDVELVVRGGPLDPDVLRVDALRTYSVYGAYGVSVFAVRGTTVDELAQQQPLVRFRCVTLVFVRSIREAGLRLDPTGRNPHHFTISFDELDAGIARLCGCDFKIWENPYHEE